jgi:hypothetical protein
VAAAFANRQENIMFRKTLIASLLATSAMTLAIASPAAAGKSDRAREAIAAAEAKVHTAENLGTGAEVPRETADARAALAVAQEDFKSGHKEDAIQDAIHASALADTAIGISQRHKDAALASARDAQRATAQNAADQVGAAKDQAVTAQQQAADANARAESAQQAAASSAADAAAARNAAAMAAAQPPAPAPQVETTTTTSHATAGHRTTHKVVRRTTSGAAPASSTDQVTTTTKVTPQ